MMTHLSRDDLEAFARKTLPAARLLSASRHLAACPECVARLRAHTGIAAAPSLAGGDEDGHLSYPRIEAWVDGTLSPPDRAQVDAHVSQCRHCAGDLEQVRAFAARMHGSPPLLALPRSAWRERLRSWFRIPQFAMAAAALAVVTVLTGSFVVIHSLDRRPQKQVALVRPPDVAPPDLPSSDIDWKDLPAGHRDAIVAAVHGEPQSGGTAALAPSDDDIEQARRKDPNAHLLLGALYQQRGMWAEAAREYRLLLDANPQSEVARTLLQNALAHQQPPP